MSPEERAEQARSRRLLVHKLSDAIRDADKGKTDDLCDLLCKLIPDPEGGLLAELIERKMKPGRKPRHSSPSEDMSKAKR